MSDNIDTTQDSLGENENKLAGAVNRLGNSAEQLTDILKQVDENQKTLLGLRENFDKLKYDAEIETIRLDTQNQIATSRNKTAIFVLFIMLLVATASAVSYARIRSESNAADAATISTFADNNRCQIDFNTKVLFILKERGRLDGESEVNLRVLLEKIAIPGSSFEQGQIYRRDYIAKSIVIRAQRDSLVFPKGKC